MSSLRQYSACIAIFMTGVATGFGIVYLDVYFRLRQEVADLRRVLHELQEDLETNRFGNRRNGHSRSNIASQYSLTASSGDDEDEFVDAVAGTYKRLDQ